MVQVIRVSVDIVRQGELSDSTINQISNNAKHFLSLLLQLKRQKNIMNVSNVVYEPGICIWCLHAIH